MDSVVNIGNLATVSCVLAALACVKKLAGGFGNETRLDRNWGEGRRLIIKSQPERQGKLTFDGVVTLPARPNAECKPETPLLPQVKTESGFVVNSRGMSLHTRRWLPKHGAPKAVVCYCPGY